MLFKYFFKKIVLFHKYFKFLCEFFYKTNHGIDGLEFEVLYGDEI
jgi:hypothetical protein